MKGLQGMIVAAGLGVIGAVCNWFYISQQARDYEKIQFLAVKPQTQIAIGEEFKQEHFMPVSIPKAHMGNLDKVAVKWESRGAVIGDKAKKTYAGDELILQDDLKTPGVMQPIQKLGPDEVAISIPVDNSTFVSSRVNPGDYISFAVNSSAVPRKNGNSDTGSSGNSAAGELEIVGPFRILMIGERTGSTEVYQATKGNSRNENIVTISVKMQNGKFEPKAQQLINLKNGVKGQIMQVVLLPSKK